MRRQRQKIKLLESGNASKEDINAAKVRYFATSDDYLRFSKAMDIPRQRERVSVDSLGTIKQTSAGFLKAKPKNRLTRYSTSTAAILVKQNLTC